MSILDPLFCAALAVGLTACGGGSGSTVASAALASAHVELLAANKPPPGKSVLITLPATTSAVVGTPVRLVAGVTDKSGKTVTGVVLTWSSADPTVAKVSASGVVTPLRPGATSVAASGGGSSAETIVSVVAAPTGVVRSRYVGTNLAGIAYWSTEFPFADMMKSGSGFSSREDSGASGAPFPAMTPEGYPAALNAGQHAVSAVAWEGSNYPAGKYVILWDGDGSISFPMSAVTVLESSANRIAINASGQGSLWVSIDRTNPTNPVRNLRFLWPGTEATYATQPFNPEFIKKITPFSMLRFKDWAGTDASPVVNWADRSRVSDLTYGNPNGVPLEVMIDLANALQVDPWFSIPHQATDDYVRQFATLLHARLDPRLKPHIEYSNEVWNVSYAQTRWAVDESAKLGLPTPYGMPSHYYAKRSTEIFKTIREVYGAADAARLVRVLAGQAVWTQFSENVLGWNDAAANADVLAIAPYFNAEAAEDVANVTETLALSSDQIIDQMRASVQSTVKSAVIANAALATRYGLKLKAYESGVGSSTHYFPADKIDAMTALFVAANRNPLMQALYFEYFKVWADNGGDTMNQYVDVGSWSKWGMWGSLEYVTQDPATAYKYRAMLDFIAARPGP